MNAGSQLPVARFELCTPAVWVVPLVTLAGRPRSEGVQTGSAESRGEWLVTLLARLVTQSGWVWQPRLLRWVLPGTLRPPGWGWSQRPPGWM